MDQNTRNASQKHWDYIIIGTGMGGSVLGLSLAKTGKKVLFCEKGLAQEKLTNTGNYTELLKNNQNTQKEQFQKSGRRFSTISDLSLKKPYVFRPFIGEGAGGSSLLYGMAMERAQKSDFSSWPVSYEEMQPFYEEAENLFGVQPPKTLTLQNEILKNRLMSQGLHPYPLPLASQQNPNCQGCQGHLCNHNNKNHAGNRALKEALKLPGALLLDECEVEKLAFEGKKITEVIVIKNQERLILKSKSVVLAAGALETPRILFRSKSEQFPVGLANSSNQVGKNLMRHLIDLYVLDAKSEDANRNCKQIAFNDFYHLPEGNGGTVQSFGKMPPIDIIFQDLIRDLSFHSKILKWGAQLISPFLKFYLRKKFAHSLVLASIVEDSPNADNQVLDTPNQTSFTYKVHSQDKLKLNRMRKNLNVLFKTYLKMKIYGGEKNTLIAHACGTCRMGSDASKSVVDKNGKAHDLENLYIADASLFPTSLGVNPALTIAANALRIGNTLNNNQKKALNRARKSNTVVLSLIEK